MKGSEAFSAYRAMLRSTFSAYRHRRFAGRDSIFEERQNGGAIVFGRDHATANLLIPPNVDALQRHRLINLISTAQRHRYFGSMQSSQALAQTVFGTFFVLDRLPLLSAVKTDDGQPAFGRVACETTAEFEKCVRTLGEPRPTSIDVWLNGPYRVAIECKLSESNFGTCSRTRLTANDTRFAKQYCDGIYTRQRDRTLNCTLTEIGARYWDYVDGLFGWPPAAEHRPCPLSSTYQLVRNILAACVQEGGRIVLDGGHALVVYDRRNPTMMDGGTISSTLRAPSVLRRISWQSLLAQWPNDTSLHWLKNELGEKYGLHPSTELPGAGSGEAILPSQLEHTRGK